MGTKQIKDFRFHFKQNSVVMVYGHSRPHPQYIAFHNYSHQRRQNMDRFTTAIMRSRRMTLDRAFRLARECDLQSQSASSVSIDGQPALAGQGKRVYW